MMKKIFKALLSLLKTSLVLLIFLALTFVLFEAIKYYQNKDSNTQTAVVESNSIYSTDTADRLEDVEGAYSSEELEFDEDYLEMLSEYKNVMDSKVSNVIVAETDIPEEYANSIAELVSEIEKEEAANIVEETIVVKEVVIEEPSKEVVEPINVVKEEVKSDLKEATVSVTTPKTEVKKVVFAKPVIAIVIDDMGISKKRTKDINSLKYPITSSFLTYSASLEEQMKVSKKSGHEVIAHIPMEAKKRMDIAPDVLKVSMKDEDVAFRFIKMLEKFPEVKGVNNHMGSLFTENKPKMDIVMEILKVKGLFFLDSKTSNKSVGEKMASKHGVSYVARNVFLDNVNDLDYILGQLNTAERLAKKNGYVIAIGHPKSQTYVALKQWLPTLKNKDIQLVHLSEIVDSLNKHEEIADNE